MKKGHYGHYSGNAKHSRVTNHNMDATKRDDEAHMEYLKEDVKYDNKHGHSDSSMTADEKHISKLAGDLKYDEKQHGAAQNGDIRQSPSKFTQFVRSVKNAESGPKWMAKNLINTAAVIAPIPSVSKINAVKNIAKAFSNAPKQYSNLGKGIWNFLKRTPVEVTRSVIKGKTATQATVVNKSRNLKQQWPSSKFKSGIGARGPVPTFPKSKPVDFMGPNPAYKIGAGGNSYPR